MATKARMGMNADFQNRVSLLLKNSQLRISSFQRATNEYRAGSLSADKYLDTLSSLFDAENIGSIVSSLADELPERDLASKLKSVYATRSRK
jgi:hypothetical protein